jgi:signal transduction histidine kinase/CheY-like chemotaxis protein
MPWIHALICLCAALFSLNSMAVVVTATTPIALAEQVAWCATDEKLDITAVASGGCVFKQGTVADMAHGFSEQAFWLRLTLENPSPMQTEHWLRIGHSRLQQVSLFEPNARGAWHRTNTGILTPASQRPVVATYPVLPLVLAAHETRTVYVRVASETFMDTTPSLWTPNAFIRTQHGIDLSRTLSIGGLLVTVFLSVLLFFKQREPTYLFFAGMLIFLAIYDASYIGLLPTYLWPSDLPYEIRLQGLAIGVSGLFFVFFVRSFVRSTHRYQRYYRVMYALAILTLLAYIWAAFVNFRVGTQLSALSHTAATLSGMAIFVRYWRDGSRAAGYILLSYSGIMPLMLYRMVMEYGSINYAGSQTSISLALTLLTPTILAAVAAHSEALHSALLQSRVVSDARMKFLAQMSHEFRTPLNTVLGYAELLRRNSPRVSLPEGIAAIKTSSRHLLGMIDDILDHVRGESGQLSLRTAPVDWIAFIQSLEQAAAMMPSRDNQFQLQLTGEMPTVVMVDELRLHNVLTNLLSNANRYTHDGKITLTCASEAMDSAHCRLTLTVSDTGQGIAVAEQARIFEPFVRGAAGKSSGIDGIGMGLVIAQQWVKLMGGEIRVNSKVGQGSQFSFSIVCELAETAPEIITIPENSIPLKKHMILVVEDDENSRKLLAMLLEDYGFEVLTAISGKDAQRFLDRRVDLVITDQLMPNGDGWSVLKDWRAHAIPIMLLSATPPDRPADLPTSLEFTCIQLKPFDANAVLKVISDTLSVEWHSTSNMIEQANDNLAPPMVLLTPLREMIAQGAVTDIAEWLADFDAQYPEYQTYTAEIATANLMLDFQLLRKLTTA